VGLTEKLSEETNRKWLMGKSNGHVTDDVTWPLKSQGRDPNTLRASISNTARYAI